MTDDFRALLVHGVKMGGMNICNPVEDGEASTCSASKGGSKMLVESMWGNVTHKLTIRR